MITQDRQLTTEETVGFIKGWLSQNPGLTGCLSKPEAAYVSEDGKRVTFQLNALCYSTAARERRQKAPVLASPYIESFWPLVTKLQDAFGVEVEVQIVFAKD